MERIVTIIIPVYSDWATLGPCLESLKRHLDSKHKVLVINDCGPEADALEEEIDGVIDRWPSFEYHRNPGNLGFVGTCNRAVFELDTSGNEILLLNSDTAVTPGWLDEMLSVLDVSASHGAVSPRSNSATHATVPLRTRDGKPTTPEHSWMVFKEIRELLPPFSVTVDAHGFCLLTRRELVDRYGLFDEAYSPGYAEETDYCLRLRANGYKSLFANRAFVFHYRAETFTTDRKKRLRLRNKKVLLDRYPDTRRLVKEYLAEVDPVDWFADVIAGPSKPMKILLDWSEMRPNEIDGWFGSIPSSDCDVAVIGGPATLPANMRRVNLEGLEELFHVGYAPGTGNRRLNRLCLRIVDSEQPSFAGLLLTAREPLELAGLRRRWRDVSGMQDSAG